MEDVRTFMSSYGTYKGNYICKNNGVLYETWIPLITKHLPHILIQKTSEYYSCCSWANRNTEGIWTYLFSDGKNPIGSSHVMYYFSNPSDAMRFKLTF